MSGQATTFRQTTGFKLLASLIAPYLAAGCAASPRVPVHLAQSVPAGHSWSAVDQAPSPQNVVRVPRGRALVLAGSDKRGCLLALLLLLFSLIPSTALAQSYSPARGVYGGAGWGRTSDDDGPKGGSGVNYVAGFGFRYSPRVSLEIEVNRMSRQIRRSNPEYVLDGHALALDGHVSLFAYADKRVQPFLTLGLGVMKYESAFRGVREFIRMGEVISAEPFSGEYSQTSLLYRLGAGIQVFASPRISVRAEWRLIDGLSQTARYWSRGFVGLGYHW